MVEEDAVTVVDASPVTDVTEMVMTTEVTEVVEALVVEMGPTSECAGMITMRNVRKQATPTMMSRMMTAMVEDTTMGIICTEGAAFVVAVVAAAVEEEEVDFTEEDVETKQIRSPRKGVVAITLLLQEGVTAQQQQKLHRTIHRHWYRRTLVIATRTVAEAFEVEVEVSAVEAVVALGLIPLTNR